MIRTKQGFFSDEFIHDGFVAIGWNFITETKIGIKPDSDQINRLKKSVKMLYGEKVRGSAVNKCIQLCRELKDGDIVVTVDNGRIAFASVGEYFEDSSSRCNVESEIELNKRIEKGDIFQRMRNALISSAEKSVLSGCLSEGTR